MDTNFKENRFLTDKNGFKLDLVIIQKYLQLKNH